MEKRPEAGKKRARTPGRRTQYPVWSEEQDFVLPTSPQPGGLPWPRGAAGVAVFH